MSKKERLSRVDLARALANDGYKDEAKILRDSLKSPGWDRADEAARKQRNEEEGVAPPKERSPEQGLHGAIRNALTGPRTSDEEVD